MAFPCLLPVDFRFAFSDFLMKLAFCLAKKKVRTSIYVKKPIKLISTRIWVSDRCLALPIAISMICNEERTRGEMRGR